MYPRHKEEAVAYRNAITLFGYIKAFSILWHKLSHNSRHPFYDLVDGKSNRNVHRIFMSRLENIAKFRLKPISCFFESLALQLSNLMCRSKMFASTHIEIMLR